MRFVTWSAALFFVVLLAGCSGTPQASPTPAATAAPTLAAVEATLIPTVTAAPTNVAATALPTNTAPPTTAPTNTAAATTAPTSAPAATTAATIAPTTQSRATTAPEPTATTAAPPTAEPPTAVPPTEPPNPAAAGLLVYSRMGCGGCHALSAAGATGNIGPPHNGLGATAAQRIQSDGYTGQAGTAADYIRESIVNPGVYIVPGFEAVPMPPFSSLSSEDLNALVQMLLQQ
jgi:cytochrome c551/c552